MVEAHLGFAECSKRSTRRAGEVTSGREVIRSGEFRQPERNHDRCRQCGRLLDSSASVILSVTCASQSRRDVRPSRADIQAPQSQKAPARMARSSVSSQTPSGRDFFTNPKRRRGSSRIRPRIRRTGPATVLWRLHPECLHALHDRATSLRVSRLCPRPTHPLSSTLASVVRPTRSGLAAEIPMKRMIIVTGVVVLLLAGGAKLWSRQHARGYP
jgi:hypothetical protein